MLNWLVKMARVPQKQAQIKRIVDRVDKEIFSVPMVMDKLQRRRDELIKILEKEL